MTFNRQVRSMGITETRKLNDSEKRMARSVFQNTVPLSKVRLVNQAGWEGRPFAFVTTDVSCDIEELAIGMAVNYVSPIAGSAYRMFEGCGLETRNFYLFVGDKYSADMSATEDASNLLIHELVHVWQGEHGIYPQMYMLESLCAQAIGGDAAYDFEIKDDSDFRDFNPEQQANIVDSWFTDGMSETDERFRFIDGAIREQAPRDFGW